MEWWHWVVLGSVLFATEIVLLEAQFYLVFIGLSAAAVGLLTWLFPDMAIWAQWVAFGALSIITVVALRKTLHERVHGNVPDYRVGVAGEFLTLDSAIEAGASGRISYRGTEWTVVNEGSDSIDSGSRVRIERSEGLTLYVGTTA